MKVAAVTGETGQAVELRRLEEQRVRALRLPGAKASLSRTDSDRFLFMVWLKSATCRFAGNSLHIWQLLLPPCN